MSADRFETLVASNSNWINQVDRLVFTNDPPSLLSLAAELDLTNHIRILIRHGANVDEAISYETKYEATNQVALIKYCQQSLDMAQR